MRTISLTMREAMNAQSTGEVAIVLLRIEHPDLAEPIRLSSDPTTRTSNEPLQYSTISREQFYLFFPFSISLPDDVGERAPVAQIQIENVSRHLVPLIRSTSSPASVSIEVVLASSPNAVEIEYPRFMLKGASYNASVMTLDLSIDALTDEPFPAGSFDPSGFPGLF